MIHDTEWAKIDQRFLVKNIKLYRLTKNISTPSESALLGTINSTDENKSDTNIRTKICTIIIELL